MRYECQMEKSDFTCEKDCKIYQILSPACLDSGIDLDYEPETKMLNWIREENHCKGCWMLGYLKAMVDEAFHLSEMADENHK